MCYNVRHGDDDSFQFVRGGKNGLGFQFGSAKIQGGSWDAGAASLRPMWHPFGYPSGCVLSASLCALHVRGPWRFWGRHGTHPPRRGPLWVYI